MGPVAIPQQPCPPGAPVNGDGDGDGQGVNGKDDYQYDLDPANPANTKSGRSIQFAGKGGSELQEWCINPSDRPIRGWKALIYKANGVEHFIGKCPFVGGKNTVSYTLTKEGNNLQSTMWNSKDDGGGGPNDPTDDDHDGFVDEWEYLYDKATNKLVQDHYETDPKRPDLGRVKQGDGNPAAAPPTRPYRIDELLPKNAGVDNPTAALPPGEEAACSALAAVPNPGSGSAPGHRALSYAFPVASYFDFKDGVGIADPTDPDSACTSLQLGLRGVPPFVDTWHGDLDAAFNLNGPGVGVSNLVPPLTPVGGWLPNSGGINLGVPCLVPGSSPGNIWLVWSGLNWRSAQWDVLATLTLCNGLTFGPSSPGCIPLPSPNLRLWATQCAGAPTFGHDYADASGKEDFNGAPYDLLGMKQDILSCSAGHSHDYTDTVREMSSNNVAQAFDDIKVEAVVHAGSGTSYMAVCWRADYLNFHDPLNPVSEQAQAHNWKLVLDIANPSGWAGALQAHLGPNQGAVALGGLYSQSETGAGENGFGPCTLGSLPEAKKPAPFV